jgi:hypothetical protein
MQTGIADHVYSSVWVKKDRPSGGKGRSGESRRACLSSGDGAYIGVRPRWLPLRESRSWYTRSLGANRSSDSLMRTLTPREHQAQRSQSSKAACADFRRRPCLRRQVAAQNTESSIYKVTPLRKGSAAYARNGAPAIAATKSPQRRYVRAVLRRIATGRATARRANEQGSSLPGGFDSRLHFDHPESRIGALLPRRLETRHERERES